MEIMNIPKEKFVPVKNRDIAHDKKLETKPVGYFKDAWNRFRKNKGSVFAFVIIICLVLFAIIGPMMTPFTIGYQDMYFANCYPKNQLFFDSGLNFWDGCSKKKDINETSFLMYQAIAAETGNQVVKNNEYEKKSELSGNYYDIRFDSYAAVGCVKIQLHIDQYKALQAYQNAHNVQIIYPMVKQLTTITDEEKVVPNITASIFTQLETEEDDLWYQYEVVNAKKIDGTTSKMKIMRPLVVRDSNDEIVLDSNGNVQFIGNRYIEAGSVTQRVKNPDGSYSWISFDDQYDSLLIEGSVKQYDYALQTSDPNMVEVRVDYCKYYSYYHQEILQDGIKEPVFWFGANNIGKDIFANLTGGARLSFIFAIVVSAVNMFVGAIYGSIEGYYGGKLDLMMERFSDILSAVPMMIVITLLKLHMDTSPHLLILFLSFFATGWIGMAGRVRMQFYRFKNQEYVLAARTLGASDRRIMFKHIFPNSLGTIVTGSVLAIPSMIFSESSLSYLGIINLETGSLTSVGTMLAAAKGTLATFPHIMLFPAIFICLLMLAFNLFGNGLRDAFNPSLRGAED